MPFLQQKRSSYLYLALVLAVALSVKYVLAYSSVETLDFLLWPPAKVVASCFSSGWHWDREQGYIFPELGMYINKGCAAINFLTILFLSLSTLVIFYTSGALRIKSLLLVLISCYPLSVLVNSFRILTSIHVNYFTSSLSLSLRESIHEFTGGLCFFSALLFFVLITEKILKKFTSPTNLVTNPSSALSL